MPRFVVCPECDLELDILPEEAGQAIECPECGAAIPPARRRPASGDTRDDEPRRRPRFRENELRDYRRTSASQLALFIGLGVLLLGSVAVTIWLVTKGASDPVAGRVLPVTVQAAQPKPATGDWKNYSCQDFDGWFPKDDEVKISSQPVLEVTRWDYVTQNPQLSFMVSATAIPLDILAHEKKNPDASVAKKAEAFAETLRKQGATITIKPIPVRGLPGREVRVFRDGRLWGIQHVFVAVGKSFTIGVAANGPRLDDEAQIQPFFDNFIPK